MYVPQLIILFRLVRSHLRMGSRWWLPLVPDDYLRVSGGGGRGAKWLTRVLTLNFIKVS